MNTNNGRISEPRTLEQALSLVNPQNYKTCYNRLTYQSRKYELCTEDKDLMYHILGLLKDTNATSVAEYAYKTCDTLLRDIIFETCVYCSGYFPDYKPRF